VELSKQITQELNGWLAQYEIADCSGKDLHLFASGFSDLCPVYKELRILTWCRGVGFLLVLSQGFTLYDQSLRLRPTNHCQMPKLDDHDPFSLDRASGLLSYGQVVRYRMF
jgi:hypothetical protein